MHDFGWTRFIKNKLIRLIPFFLSQRCFLETIYLFIFLGVMERMDAECKTTAKSNKNPIVMSVWD